jgi:hypothetical protein
MIRVLLAIVAIFPLLGCEGSQQSVGQYQVISSAEGKLLRVDTKTGEVTIVEIEKPKLKVNSLYEAEDGKVLKYVGNGRLEPRPPLDAILSPK